MVSYLLTSTPFRDAFLTLAAILAPALGTVSTAAPTVTAQPAAGHAVLARAVSTQAGAERPGVPLATIQAPNAQPITTPAANAQPSITQAANALPAATTQPATGPAAAIRHAFAVQPTALPSRHPEIGIHPATEKEPFAVGVWPARPFPGSLLVIDVAGVPEGVTPEATFLGKPLIWHRFSPGVWRGMGPVADDAPGGPATLALKAGDKGRLVGLEVEKVAFDADELRVDGKFTKLPPAAQKKIAQDRKGLAAMWRKGSSGHPHFAANFELPRQARTTAPYGTRRTFNGQTRSVHHGWDLDGKVGDPIVSPNDGVVTMAEDLYYSGGTLFIDHGGGLYTGYFHMSRFDVKPGDVVKKGQLVGAVGKSGRVTGPHLHWAAKIGGHYLNPASLLFFDFEKPMVRPPGEKIVEEAAGTPMVVPATAVQ